MNKEIEERISKAKLAFLIRGANRPTGDIAMFAALATRLDYIETKWCPTMCTDGVVVRYNPEWCATLTDSEMLGVIAHEILHIVLDHCQRRENRHPLRWNIAVDCAVNSILSECQSITLPKDIAMPGTGAFKKFPKFLSGEEYYAMLADWTFELVAMPGKGDGSGYTMADGSGKEHQVADAGGVSDTSEEDQVISEGNREAAISAGKLAGNMPGNLARLIHDRRRPKINWKEVLREFFRSLTKSDYTWAAPNRRFIHRGLYLPSLTDSEVGHVAISVDCSGSIDQETLDMFAAEVQAIAETSVTRLTILYHNVDVEKVQVWDKSDGPLKLEPCNSGGTSHQDVFRKTDKLEDIICLIGLTDLYSDFPKAPQYPVLWAVAGSQEKPPFGTALYIEK